MRYFQEIIDRAKALSGKKIALAGAQEADSLLAVEKARKENIAETILVGDKKAIEKVADEIGVDLSKFEIVEEPDPRVMSKVAVSLVRGGKADVLMKGLVGSADYTRAILDKENGLLASELISHIGLFEVPNYHKLISITDAAINIAPTLQEKVSIINNAVKVYHKLGIEKPKIACVCALEKVNPKMPCTEEAAILAGMNRTGQIAGAIVDGPLALDNAINKEAAELKGVKGEVAGDADIILCPNIESANIFYKSLTYLAGCECAAIVVGTSAPVVLTSRADSDKSKFASIALAIAIS